MAAKSSAQRSREWRERRRAEREQAEREKVTALPAPVPQGMPAVAGAVEQWLSTLTDPHPAVAAVTRALAASIDAKGVVAAADAAELRRCVTALAAGQGAPAAGGGSRPVTALEQLRAARAKANRERGGA